MRPFFTAFIAVALAGGAAWSQPPQERRPLPNQGQPPRNPDRAQLEAQIRFEGAQKIREIAQLSDSQYTKLLGVNQQLAQRARQVTMGEQRARTALVRQLGLGEAANQDSIAILIDQLMLSNQQRLDLVRHEQNLLGAFLNPRQRAQYMALQETLHRRMDDMVAQGAARRGGGPVGRVGRPGGAGGARGQLPPPQNPPVGPPPPGTPPPEARKQPR